VFNILYKSGEEPTDIYLYNIIYIFHKYIKATRGSCKKLGVKILANTVPNQIYTHSYNLDSLLCYCTYQT